MWTKVRSILAVLAGCVSATVVMVVVESINGHVLYPEVGCLVGGLVAAWIGSNAPVAHAMVLGGALTLAGIANKMMIPPPMWFWVVSLLVFLPAACAGARLAPAKSQARA